MPTYEITAPDGSLYEVDAPEGATEQDVLSYAQTQFSSSQKGSSIGNIARGLAQGGAQGATLGLSDEAEAALRGITGSDYAQSLEQIRNRQNEIRDAAPTSYMVGEIAGSILPTAAGLGAVRGVPLAAKAAEMAGRNVLTRGAAALGAGAVSGGLYGYGTGEGGNEQRLENAVSGGQAGLIGGALGAAASPLVSRALGPLASRAQKIYGKELKTGPIDSPTKSVPQTLPTGQSINLTKGQATGDAGIQSLENMALKGAAGKEAQDMALAARYAQQQQIRDVLGEVGGEGDLGGAALKLRKAYNSSKAKVGKAYEDAKVIQGVFVDKQPLSEELAPRVQSILREGGFDRADMSERGQKLINQVVENKAFKDPKITSINLENMEFWRRKVSNAIQDNTDAYGKLNSEGVALKRILDEYDGFMGKLPEDALKSGDEAALKAINEARSLRRRQGVLFEKDKVIEKMVKNNDLTPEELANMALSGSAGSDNIGPSSGRLVKNMKRAAGENAQALQDDIRKGAIARLLTKSSTKETIDGTDIDVLSPQKLRDQLDKLLNNKSFTKEVFSEDQIKALRNLRSDVQKLSNVKPGSDNYSNTAYTIMKYIQGLPLGLSAGSAISTPALQAVGDRAAANEARKSFGQVLQNYKNEINMMPRIYGASAGGVVAAPESGE